MHISKSTCLSIFHKRDIAFRGATNGAEALQDLIQGHCLSHRSQSIRGIGRRVLAVFWSEQETVKRSLARCAHCAVARTLRDQRDFVNRVRLCDSAGNIEAVSRFLETSKRHFMSVASHITKFTKARHG